MAGAVELTLRIAVASVMHLITRRIVFPEGEAQEIEHGLAINQLVDVNGVPVPLPLPTSRMIVYRVYRISTDSRKGEDIISYYLDLVWREELEELVQ